MDPPVLLERLMEDGVLSIPDEGDSVVLSRSFRAEVEEHRDAVVSDSALAAEMERIGLPASATDYDGWTAWRDFVALYRALQEESELQDHGSIVQLVLVLQSLEHASPDLDAVPTDFLPVTGEQMYTYMQLSLPTLVYVWRNDCDPCDVMRDSIDEAIREPLDGILKVAVNGSDCPALLAETVDVVGAPTLLFVREGRVEARLVGPSAPTVVRSEIEKIAPNA